MNTIRIKYADYLKLNLRKVKGSYDEKTKTVEVETYNPYLECDYMEYVDNATISYEDALKAEGVEDTEENRKAFEENQKEIIDFLTETVGEEFRLLKKYL